MQIYSLFNYFDANAFLGFSNKVSKCAISNFSIFAEIWENKTEDPSVQAARIVYNYNKKLYKTLKKLKKPLGNVRNPIEPKTTNN